MDSASRPGSFLSVPCAGSASRGAAGVCVRARNAPSRGTGVEKRSFWWQRAQERRSDSVGFRTAIACSAVGSGAEVSGEGAKTRSSKRQVGRGSKLIGTGSAIPSIVISNDDLSAIVETSDEWIATRTGIRSRRILSEEESMTGLATQAAKRALEMSGVDPLDIDLVILCTSTPDDIFGSACLVQSGLGCTNATAFDLTAACSGFVMGLVTGSNFIRGGGYENVLVVGADALSRYVDWHDRGTCILFGDGAGAVVLQAAAEDEEDGVLGFSLRSDGNGNRHLQAAISSSLEPQNGSAVRFPGKASPNFIKMNGREVYKFAVKSVPQVLNGALEEAGLEASSLDWLLLHQANQRILDAVSDKFGIPKEKVLSNLANYGNTSAASIPLALDEAVRGDKVKPGQFIAVAGFGAGLSWGAAVLRWK